VSNPASIESHSTLELDLSPCNTRYVPSRDRQIERDALITMYESVGVPRSVLPLSSSMCCWSDHNNFIVLLQITCDVDVVPYPFQNYVKTFRVGVGAPTLDTTHLNALKDLQSIAFQDALLPAVADLSSLSKLTTFHATLNSFTSFSAKGLVSLNTLYIESTPLTDFPTDMQDAAATLQTLTLKNNALNDVSADRVAGLHALQSLILDNNVDITQFPHSICTLNNLHTLSIAYASLRSLESCVFSDLPHLNTIAVNNNRLLSLPDNIATCSSLQKVQVEYNQLISLPDAQQGYPNITMLSAGSNPLMSLPSSLLSNPSLERLYISDVLVSSVNFVNAPSLMVVSLLRIPTLQALSISGPCAITSLTVRNCPLLSTLSPSLASCTRLGQIDISFSSIQSVPAEFISSVNKITYFIAENCLLRSLPPTLAQLTSLVALNLGDNQLDDAAVSNIDFSQLRHLQSLRLFGNRLTHFPASLFPKMPNNLQYVEFQRNHISYPEPVLSLQAATLVALNVSFNNLESSLNLTGLPWLQTLDASHNRIRKLAPANDTSWGTQFRLVDIYVQSNMLEELPVILPNRLQHLVAANNSLTQFPPAVYQLNQLQQVDLAMNFIPSFADKFTTDPLQRLNLSHNRITNLPYYHTHIDVMDLNYNQIAFPRLAANGAQSILELPSVVLTLRGNAIPYLNYVFLDISSYAPSLIQYSMLLLDLSDNNMTCPDSSATTLDSVITALSMHSIQSVNLRGNPYLGSSTFLNKHRTDSIAYQLLQTGSAIVDRARIAGVTGLRSGSVQVIFEDQPEQQQESDSEGILGPVSLPVNCGRIQYSGAQVWNDDSPSSQAMVTIDLDDSAFGYALCRLPPHSYPVSTRDDTPPLVHASGMELMALLRFPDAAPRCPDASYGFNPCVGDVTTPATIANFSCASGYDVSSFMCSRCLPSHMRAGGKCLECNHGSRIAAPILWSLTLVLIVFFLRWKTNRSADVTAFSASTIAVFIFHTQMISFLAETPVPWPHFVTGAIDNFLGWARIHTESLGCTFGDPPAGAFVDVISSACGTPLVVTGALIGILVIRWVLRQYCADTCNCFDNDSVAHKKADKPLHDRIDLRSEPLLMPQESTTMADDPVLGDVHESDEALRDWLSAAQASDTTESGFQTKKMDGFVFAYMWLLRLVYMPTCLTVFQAFGKYQDAVYPQVPPRLAADLDVEYAGSEWHTDILPWAVFGIIVYVFGVPIFFGLASHGYLGNAAHQATRFQRDKFRSNFSAFGGYVTATNLASWFMAQEALLALLLGLSSPSSILPLVFVLWLLVCLTLFHVRYTPYCLQPDNILQVRSLVVLQLTYAASISILDASAISTREVTAVVILISIVNTLFAFFGMCKRGDSNSKQVD
jgi:Leucine-rich repeat (LRR) protein